MILTDRFRRFYFESYYETEGHALPVEFYLYSPFESLRSQLSLRSNLSDDSTFWIVRVHIRLDSPSYLELLLLCHY